MADQLDQISDAQAAVQKEREEKNQRTLIVCTFVFLKNGKWKNVTYRGTMADCSEAFVQKIDRERINLGKVPWARGHMSGRSIVIHPKTDATAEAEVRRVMAKNPKPIPVGER